MRRGCVPLLRKKHRNAHSRQYSHGTPAGFHPTPARTFRPGRRGPAHGAQHDQSLRGGGRTAGRQAVQAPESAAGRHLHLLPPEQGPPLVRTRRAAPGAGRRLARTRRMERIPPPRAALRQLLRLAVQLHEKGIEHRDFNHGNILWNRTPAGAYRFQLIDINRMHFDDRPLSSRACMINLRRLSCPAVAFLYILDRYAETRGWNVDDTLLRGTFFRLAFGRRKQLRKRFRHRKG